jgi:hypothetical protein
MISRKNFGQSCQGQTRKVRDFQGLTKILALVSLLFLLSGQSSLASPQPPNSVIDATRQDLSQKTNIPINRLQVKSAKTQTWPDGCLGLAKSGELCTQALVEGWRIILTNNQKTWIYRTDRTGSNLRLEN